ncbi:MAG: ATP-binding protein [Lentihominibacter sp.]|jgi:hypothetical protein
MKRIILLVGHFGSGKTEVSVNVALDYNRNMPEGYERVAVLDLDIANPYFRSREKQEFLEEKGIEVHFNTFGYDISEDLPAISAGLRGPLEKEGYIAVVDVGGNDSGARVLNQFMKYFSDEDTDIFCVLNANRPETETVDGMLEHMRSIELETGLRTTGIINNTHMLRETTVSNMLGGYEVCREASRQSGVPIVFNTCRRDLLPELEETLHERGLADEYRIYPIDLYMRPTWLDR